MEVKYQVFVSSTFEDLKDERKEICQAILESNCIPAGMELFPASNKTQWEVIKKVIDESDFYIVVLAGIYGSVGTDDNGHKVSYTEMEFDYAFNSGKPIIALIRGNIDSLPKSKSETSEKRNRQLKKFYSKVMCGRTIKKWVSKEELRANTIMALNELKKDTDSTGWIKADPNIDVYSFSVFDQQRKEFEKNLEN